MKSSLGARRFLVGAGPAAPFVAVVSVAVLVAGLLADDTPRRPAMPVDVARLVEQLGSDQYVLRRQAEKTLIRMGIDAFDALKAAESHDDVEIAARATYLTELIPIEWVSESDSADVKRILKSYATHKVEERRKRIESLAAQATDDAFLAICRVVRFEPSPILSKRAALAILQSAVDAQNASRVPTEDALQALGASERPGARWLRTHVDRDIDRLEAPHRWAEFAEEEVKTLKRHPDHSRPEFALTLLRFQARSLQQLGRRDEAVGVMMRMVGLEPGRSDTLMELLDWLVEQEAWSVIDEVQQRFAERFQVDPLLLYMLAEARSLQGMQRAASEAARQAAELNQDKPLEHWRLAYELQRRGLRKWAEQEYRVVLQSEPETSGVRFAATMMLSELLHDERRELDAAEVLAELVQAMGDEADKERAAEIEKAVRRAGSDPNSVRSRLEYFRACDARERDQLETHRALLEKAIRFDPTDADVLISMYRLADVDEAYRRRTVRLIEQAAASFRKEIERNPDDPAPYNQFAWLVGNTEGDYDEAVRMSEKSLELRPDSAGYFDTLAHCHFAKRDYALAVRFQRKAATLEPHTAAIARQLRVFEQAQAASKVQ